jgi:hypothetical protein
MRQHPSEAIAAIDALAIANVTAPEIKRRLGLGEIPGVPATDIPLRTVQQYAQKAKQRHEEDAIAGDDVDSLDALEGRMLRIVKRDVARLDLKSKRTGLSANELATLKTGHAFITQVRAERRKGVGVVNPTKQAAGSQGGLTMRPTSIIDRIAKDIEQRESTAVEDGINTPA